LSPSHARIAYSRCEYDPDPENFPEEDQIQRLPDESEDDYWERKLEWARATRRVVMPEPEVFRVPTQDEDEVDLKSEFGKRGLQVIVKLANIHLTPDKPEYEGGTWHVEGQLVCAP
jgi:hypothetical protein